MWRCPAGEAPSGQGPRITISHCPGPAPGRSRVRTRPGQVRGSHDPHQPQITSPRLLWPGHSVSTVSTHHYTALVTGLIGLPDQPAWDEGPLSKCIWTAVITGWQSHPHHCHHTTRCFDRGSQAENLEISACRDVMEGDY